MSDDDTLLDDLLSCADGFLEGAATQAAESDADLDGTPRILRYAILGTNQRTGTRRQLAAEIVELAPELRVEAQAWMHQPRLDHTLKLAGHLDRLSVEQDKPAFRSLADCVRLIGLPLPKAGRVGTADYMRVLQTLAVTRGACDHLDIKLRARIDYAVLAWAIAPLLARQEAWQELQPAIVVGAVLADEMTASILAAAQEVPLASEHASDTNTNLTAVAATDEYPCPAGHLIICRREIVGSITARHNENLRPHVHVLNTPVPLVPAPDLRQVRTTLLAEYPYAQEAVDFCISGLIGRPYIQFEPILLVGEAGCGKTRFAKRFAELLDVGLWRVDGTQADGSAFGGTDKRWATASPCGPLLAISRYRHANPIIAVDEIEKAATRSDYGTLWNTLTAFCERENTQSYPDPALGAEVNVSWVSYIATANSTTPLPGPLLDRFRTVQFASPRLLDVDALAESFRLDLAKERGLDNRFIAPLSAEERNAIAKQWQGGSARRLRRMLDVLWRARERTAHFH